jgi:hypothetical protein
MTLKALTCAPRCCSKPCLTRRELFQAGSAAAAGLTLAGCSWRSIKSAADETGPQAPGREALVVKPILVYDVPQRKNQSSWRNWGGIHTPEAANEEMARIQKELDQIKAKADFPVSFLPVAGVRGAKQIPQIEDTAQADAIVLYAAGGWMDAFDACLKTGKPLIIFIRHRSGPVYLWYEIISPRFLHQHKDELSVKGVDNEDVVVDSLDDLTWRLRALMGLKNTMGMKIVAVGGAGGWAQPKAPEFAREKFKLDIQNLPYSELKKLIAAAREDAAAVKLAKERAEAYLKGGDVKLETGKPFVENCFLLDHVFRGLMTQAGARAITVNSCMGTIMPIAETTACLTLSTLNDAGFQAYCESDFVVIPSGMLLSNISGLPQFLNDPTYPHHGVVTVAHCSGPRKMDGKSLEPVRLVTHFESDYGAAPKVEMKKGTVCTNIIPDFGFKKYFGFRGEIADAPFLPICRDQVDVAYKIPDEKIALNMPGFHWEFCYGDYLKEFGYALKKTGIGWECLG